MGPPSLAWIACKTLASQQSDTCRTAPAAKHAGLVDDGLTNDAPYLVDR